MPTRFGADGGFASTTSGGVFDSSGNPIVSADNEFGSAPLGPAALAQTLFSVPNGTFNILPPDIDIPISNENPLPYWSSPVDNSDGEMIAQVVYNTTSNTYSLRMDPGSALSGDTLSITTRSAVISDDNLSLRQKAIATLEKVGTYAGTTQVNLKLDATYYDHTGTQLSTNPIGTVFDNGTVSSLAEFTTAGTAIVGISAAYVDLTFTMTATADVTSGIAFDIDTILLQTSQGGGGGGAASFLIAETFTSSDTWTRPTGVDYLVAVVALGAGGGGASGGSRIARAPSGTYRLVSGSAGGGGAAWGILRDLYVGDVASVSIGIGAGGSGGTATEFTKAAAGTTNFAANGVNGSSGGTTTFGTYFTATGGAGGFGGNASGAGNGGVGGSAGSISTIVFGLSEQVGGAGGVGGDANNTPLAQSGSIGLSSAGSPFTIHPYLTALPAAGGSGGTATTNVTGSAIILKTGTIGTSVAGFGGGGGGAAAAAQSIASQGTVGVSAGNGGWGGAGGGGASFTIGVSGTGITTGGTAGDGGNATANSGAGGGAGGGALCCGGTTVVNAAAITVKSGAGGAGAAGFVTVVYVG
jgi:hypothetical protein